jgi:hypothetical protein
LDLISIPLFRFKIERGVFLWSQKYTSSCRPKLNLHWSFQKEMNLHHKIRNLFSQTIAQHYAANRNRKRQIVLCVSKQKFTKANKMNWNFSIEQNFGKQDQIQQSLHLHFVHRVCSVWVAATNSQSFTYTKCSRVLIPIYVHIFTHY